MTAHWIGKHDEVAMRAQAAHSRLVLRSQVYLAQLYARERRGEFLRGMPVQMTADRLVEKGLDPDPDQASDIANQACLRLLTERDFVECDMDYDPGDAVTHITWKAGVSVLGVD